MGTIIDIALVTGCGTCAFQAVAAYARLARTEDGRRDAGSWHAPLIFTSGTFILLGGLGVLPSFFAALFALFPLLVVTRIVWRAWRETARRLGRARATALVLRGLAGRVRDALRYTREDLRGLLGKLRRPAILAGGTAPEAAGRADSRDVVTEAARHVPPLRGNAALGEAPAPAELAAVLDAAGAAVLPEFAAVADLLRDFDPDDDEDELLGFVAAVAAGFMYVFEAFPDLAENLMTGVGLDPAYAMGFIDIGDEGAEFTAAFALLDRLYHELHEGIHEHVDAGKTMPHNSRQYFHADGEGGGAA